MGKKALGILTVLVLLILGYVIFVQNKPKKVEDSQITKTAPQTANPDAASQAASVDKLVAEDLKVGTGSAVKSGDTVSIHYLGTLTNGTKFDSSYDRGKPFETQIGVGQVIKVWDEGVVGMQVGGKRKLTIPPDMAYGARALPGIPAH